MAFAFGVLTVVGIVMLSKRAPADRGPLTSNRPVAIRSSRPTPDNVYALLALSDDELAQLDVVALNLAVARELPGLEDFDV